MAAKKIKKNQKLKQPVTEKLSFLLYGKGSVENLKVLENSLNALHPDMKNSISIYMQEKGNEEYETESISLIKYNDKSPFASVDPNHLLICLPFNKLESSIPFNAFFNHPGIKDIQENTRYGRLFWFKDSVHLRYNLILPGKIVEELNKLPFHSDSPIDKQIEWYLNRSGFPSEDIILTQKNPLQKTGPLSKLNPPSFHNLRRSLYWNISLPLKERKNKQENYFTKDAPGWRLVFTVTSLIILFLLPVLSYQAGISGDEEKHYLHAEKVYNYFKTDGEDSLALSDPKYKLHYYGQSFDLLSYVVIKTFNIEKIYETRHVMNGIFGALAIITAGILIQFLGGSFAGFLTLIFIFLFPRFLGHSMNNPLDIPFALGYVFSIYQMIRFLDKLPEFSLRHAFLLALGIAYTTSVRIGGLILVPYLFLFSGLWLVFRKWPWKLFSPAFFRFTGKGILFLTGISVFAYFLSILSWPYALQDPIHNPFKALGMMSNITVALRVMFEGKIIWSDSLPWNYVIKNMELTIPVLIWVLFLISSVLFLDKKKKIKNFWLFVLFFVTLFPVLYIIYKESNVYGGWRHTMFIYPCFAGLAALGASSLRSWFSKPWMKTALVLIIIPGLYHPVKHILKNYPLQYIYFNEISGGVNKAFRKYETDYYLNSLKPATEWFIENIAEKNEDDQKLIVASNAPYETMKYYYRNHLDKITFPYTRYYDRGSKDWDYAIYYCNYINPYQLRKGIWPPKNTIYEVKVDSIPVCVVVKRENKADYQGLSTFNLGVRSSDYSQIMKGVSLLKEAIAYDPHNEVAHLILGQGYISLQQFSQARGVLNKLLQFYPDYDKALNLIAFSYINEGQVKSDAQLIDRGIIQLGRVLKINYKFVEAYYNLGLAYYLKGEDQAAVRYLNKSIEYNSRYKKSYYLMAEIMKRNGNEQRYNEIMNFVNSF